MYSTRTSRRHLRRVAACTATALSAGLLLSAGPASAVNSADGVELPRVQFTLPVPAGAPTVPVPAKPRTDIDLDGRNDLLYRYVDGSLSVLPGNGGPERPAEFVRQIFEYAKEVIPIGDVRGDDRPELLYLQNQILILETAGGYDAGYRQWAGGDWQLYNKVTSPGDVNGDGHPDLVARTHSGDLYFYAGTGLDRDQPFAPRVKVGGGWQAYDQIVGANDLDGDGLGDLVARDVSGSLWYYKGSGGSAQPFAVRVKVGAGWNAYNQVVPLDDVTGDGRADLAGRTPAGQVFLYASKGDGAFAAPTQLGTGAEYLKTLAGQGGVPDHGKHALAAAKPGHDGRVEVFRTLANGTFLPAQVEYTSVGDEGTGFYFAATGLNGTDYPSLVMDEGVLWDHEGQRVLTDKAGASLTPGGIWQAPGDLTGDGRADLLQVQSGVLYLHDRGSGGSGYDYRKTSIGKGWEVYDSLVGSGDFTGDGRADAVARDKSGLLYLYAGTGNASAPFAPRLLIGKGWEVYDLLAAPGDLNGDGRADLVARDAAGDLYRYSATGLGGSTVFGPRARMSGGWNAYRLIG